MIKKNILIACFLNVHGMLYAPSYITSKNTHETAYSIKVENPLFEAKSLPSQKEMHTIEIIKNQPQPTLKTRLISAKNTAIHAIKNAPAKISSGFKAASVSIRNAGRRATAYIKNKLGFTKKISLEKPTTVEMLKSEEFINPAYIPFETYAADDNMMKAEQIISENLIKTDLKTINPLPAESDINSHSSLQNHSSPYPNPETIIIGDFTITRDSSPDMPQPQEQKTVFQSLAEPLKNAATQTSRFITAAREKIPKLSSPFTKTNSANTPHFSKKNSPAQEYDLPSGLE